MTGSQFSPSLAEAAATGRSEAGNGRDADTRLESVDRSGPLPLSFPQQRLWFLDRLAPGNPFYTMSTSWRLNGELDIAALSKALESVVERHEVLRTRLLLEDGVPVQVIGPAWPMPLEPVDVDGADVLARAGELVTAEVGRPFDLESGRQLRAHLLRLGDEEHILTVAVHHVACDVWSLDVLDRELWTSYRSISSEGAAQMPPLPVQYGDFAFWQRAMLTPGRLEPRLGWWRRYLADAPTVMELPTDKVRPEAASYRGAAQRIKFPVGITTALRKLAEGNSTTLFAVLLAGFQAVMARWTGQVDMVTGVPVAGRSRPELENLVGFFVNTLPVRGRLDGDPTFAELLLRTRDSVLGALAHQEVPFEALVEDLAPDRDLSRNPLVQVVFQLMTTPGSGDRWKVGDDDGGRLRGEGWFRRERTSSHFDLSVRIYELGDELAGEAVYATDLFEADTIARLTTWLERALVHVAEDPSCRLSDLPLVTEEEWRGLGIGRGTGAEEPETLTALIDRQVGRVPDRPALRWEGGELTYAQLAQRAAELAAHLRTAGVGPERVVGLCCEAGPAVAAGIWGILQAGGAYLVLDPDQPDQRLSHMVTETRAVAVVTEAGLAARVAGLDTTPLVLDETGRLTGTDGATEVPAVDGSGSVTAPSDDNLAYVAYTSGSTGTPKGVMVTHRHLANYVSWCLSELPLGEGEAVPLASPVAFAGSILSLFGAWTSGRCLVMGAARDPFSWCESETAASFVKITPSALRFVAERFGRCFDRWGCVVLASEPIRATDRRLAGKGADLAVVSHYGSTETNGSAMWWTNGDRDPDAADGLLGRPAAGARLLVVDGFGAPLGVGVVGELCIGGTSVARGYWRRPSLTAERFVPDPYGPPGARMFKTGDLVRWRSDGNLEFVGRADSLLKVRGFRVEPGEVESALEDHPTVLAAAVDLRAAEGQAAELVAWVQSAWGADFDADALRAWAADRLPTYMVPTVIVGVEELPLSANGKLDRRRLPDPLPRQDTHGAHGRQEVTLSLTEDKLAGIWAELLRRDNVGRDDNFFALGGHSLLAIQLISQVRETFGVEYPLTSLFESPSVAAMAAHIDQVSAAPDRPDAGQGL